MNTVAFQVGRICAVIALVCVAAALATPKGRLPLALRGLERVLKGGKVEKLKGSSAVQPSAWKRLLAFLLVLLATLLALI